MSREFRVYGPPGTGKTTYLSRVVEDAAQRRGSERVVVVSYTRAAAAEIASRGLSIDKTQIGTLHSLCYRGLDNPSLVETPEGYAAWNKEHMAYRLSGGALDLDEPSTDVRMETTGDVLFSQYQLLRNRLTPRALWPMAVQAFALHWEEWKAAQGGIDFCDMIELAYRDIEVPPFSPSVFIVDEAQDLTPLQAALIRKWGAHVDDLVMAGDDDQCLYDFVGATAEVFLNPPLPPEQKRVLAQSYRVPRAVQAKAQRWIEQVTHREPKDYRARDIEGEIRRLPSATWKLPERAVADMEQYLGAGKTVMVLTSCSYMLEPLKAILLRAGMPFHNPYRRKRGDWNPLSAGTRTGVNASQRLLAFLRADYRTWGDDYRFWTPAELGQWLAVIQAEGNLSHGSKAEISRHGYPNTPTTEEEIVRWFEEYALICALGGDLEWFREALLASKRKVMEFPIKVAEKYGGARLKETPQIILGTIHSVKGGEVDCSPSDEPVLTTNRGWVAISDLDPDVDRLVGFNSDHHKVHRGGPIRPDGYRFKKASRPYRGRVLRIVTAKSTTRVTPNHYLTVRWSPEALSAWVVYLMQRGTWWRIGVTKLHQQPRGQSGILMRLRHEKAHSAWILGCFTSQKEALFFETLWSHQYQVPDLTFEQVGKNGNQLGTEDLTKIWDGINSEEGALRLLKEWQLDKKWPMWSFLSNEGRRIRQTGIRNRWPVRACNLLPGYMEIPTDPGKGTEPFWLPFVIQEEQYDGIVYSLEVERWHHYVSGGAIVHNCVYLFPDVSQAGFSNWVRAGPPRDSIVRQFYVGMTRARESLILCAPCGLAVNL